MLNMDFFQPTTYSVGAIYLTVMNSIRYKSENVILAGLIPGPDEPEMNSFLELKSYKCYKCYGEVLI